MGIFRRGARGTIDIVADILGLCGSPTRKTSIMYKANLSHQMLKFYLWHMTELGLLKQSEDSKFVITEKGNELLFYYHKVGTILAGLGYGRNGQFIIQQGPSDEDSCRILRG